MKRQILTLAAALSMGATIQAQNPVIQTCYACDPAPMVHGDRFYLYTGQDEPGADFFWMYKWRLFSSTDMVNWTDHGCPIDLSTFKWADSRAWAAQCIERNGKFYWYVCAHSKLTNAMAIGVAVADSPTGPFKDALGKPLADGNWSYIDPTVMIDDDGQAYLYWGNPDIFYVRLNKDMISYTGEIKKVNQTVEGFGAPGIKQREKGKKYKDCYTEGPWIRKSGDKYQLLYAAGGIPEHLAWSEAPTPDGPWTYKGELMPQYNSGSFTNHCGIATYKGKNYIAYHDGKLPGGGGFARSTSLEEFEFNADGTLPVIHATPEGVRPIGTLNPFVKTQAETIAFSEGLHTDWNNRKGVIYVSDIHNDDYIKVREVDFTAAQAKSITTRVASALQGGTIEIHLDSIKGKEIGKVEVPGTKGWEEWKNITTPLTQIPSGKHDVYFVFKGHKGVKLFNWDWWRFNK